MQCLTVLAPDVPAAGQLREGAERGRRPDLLVGPAVHELEQLDGELDVAQPAGAQLELPLGVPGRDLVDHPATHRLGVADEALPLGRGPHHGRDDGHVLSPRARSPATGRAFSSAWNSQVFAQRS